MKKRANLILLLVLLASAIGLFGIAASASSETAEAPMDETSVMLEWGTVPYIENDTVTLGDYTPFTPSDDVDTFAGKAIEGNEEEELQQERIAGGAVGEATSQVEELHGITDYSPGEYVPVYGAAESAA